MDTEPIEPPMRWLLREVEAHLTPLAYSERVAQFEAHKRQYDRASLLRHTRRELAYYERIVATGSTHRPQYYRDKIMRRKRRIAELEAELGSTT